MSRFLISFIAISIAGFALEEQVCPTNILESSKKDLAQKFYEKAFIHSLNGEVTKAQAASDCSLKLLNNTRWDIEPSFFYSLD
jgi:hypothetical protein